MSRKWTKEQKLAMSEKVKERWRIWKNQPVPASAEAALVLKQQGGEAREDAMQDSGSEHPHSRGGPVLSKTDQKFWSLRPGYYDFTKDGEWRRKCKNCHEDFVTRLEHNRFCSPNCRNEWLTRHETRGA